MNVMLATPCYVSNVTMHYAASLFTLSAQAAYAGLGLRLETHASSNIASSRNQLVMKFLADPSLTHLFFWDADVMATPQAAFRLLLADKDVIAGVYPLKQYNWPDRLPAGMTRKKFEDLHMAYPFTPLGTCTDDDGFAEVQETTTGFMCIKRDVFAKLIAAYPELYYIADRGAGGEQKGKTWAFFDFMRTADHRALTEDYAFCKLWRDTGGAVWVDVESKLGHLGQHLFQGDFAESLTAKSAPYLAVA